MREVIYTDKKPNLLLAITVQASKEIDLKVRAVATYETKGGKMAPIPFSEYSNREGVLHPGPNTFYIRLPRTPNILVIDIYNMATGPAPTGYDNGFKLVKIEKLPLDTHPQAYNSSSTLIKSAMNFLQEFAERAPLLSAGPEGSIYRSDDGIFRIDYLDEIIERNPKSQMYGQILSTPARISIDKAEDGTYPMEVSRACYLKYPIPYRVGIGTHEISHPYLNVNSSDEFECDRNALAICLGRGYGYIDMVNAFNTVFEGAPSDQNVARNQEIEEYVDKFEKRYNRYK